MKYFVADVFTDTLFGGNPAGICPMEAWPADEVMLKIAFENNLAETAFFVPNGDHFDLRWFTPKVEMDLCGHATLGSAFVMMEYLDTSLTRMDFHTQSGVLTVRKENEIFIMDFPARPPLPCPKPAILEKALGVPVQQTYASRDLLAVVDSDITVRDLRPDFALLSEIKEFFGIIVTAQSSHSACDFVSRFFAPNDVGEDPVTGSTHCTLIPFWSERLQKTILTARQLSERGGTLYCKQLGERVEIGGTARLYLSGEINVSY